MQSLTATSQSTSHSTPPPPPHEMLLLYRMLLNMVTLSMTLFLLDWLETPHTISAHHSIFFRLRSWSPVSRLSCPSGPTSRSRPLCSSSGWTRLRGRWAGSMLGQRWRRPRLSSISYGVWCEVFDVCECVITKLCDECLYWLVYIHQLMHINLFYQCLRLSCPCVCVAECHLWLEITYVQQTL